MKFHILTLFPQMVLDGLNTSIIGRAAAQGIIGLNAVNIRDYTLDKHGKVDDYPYGGGAGMLMQAQPVFDAYQAVAEAAKLSNGKRLRTIYVTPQGRTFTQKLAEELAAEEELVFLCGHYEGIDERVLEEIVTDYISIGDYVLTGGELPAMVMIDAISRLVPGVLNNEMSAETESFHNDLLEYPQYSRPEVWRGKEVPKVLLSGNHKNIVKWRMERAQERTSLRRPDLYHKYLEKQDAINALSRKKREHIHLMELLFRGNADILFRQGEDILAYDRKSDSYILSITSMENAQKATALIPGEASAFTVNQEYLIDLIQQKVGVMETHCCKQACYTRKEPLYIKHKDIRRLDQSYLDYIAKNRAEDERSYLVERLEKGCMFGVFCAEADEEQSEIVGFAGIRKDGSMGMLYVEEKYCSGGFAESLLSWLINRQLEMGWTPYYHIDVSDQETMRCLENLGLYLSVGNIYRLNCTG